MKPRMLGLTAAFAVHALATLATQVLGIRNLGAVNADLFFLSSAIPTYFGSCLASVAQKHALASEQTRDPAELMLSSGVPSAIATMLSILAICPLYPKWLGWLGYGESVSAGEAWQLLGIAGTTTAISAVSQAQRLRLGLHAREFEAQVGAALISSMIVAIVVPVCTRFGVRGFAVVIAVKAMLLVGCFEAILYRASLPSTYSLAPSGTRHIAGAFKRLANGLRWTLISKLDGITDRTLVASLAPGAVSIWSLMTQLNGQLMQAFDSMLAPSIYRRATKAAVPHSAAILLHFLPWGLLVALGWFALPSITRRIETLGAFALLGDLSLQDQSLFSLGWGVVTVCILGGYVLQYRISLGGHVERGISLTSLLFIVTIPLRWIGVKWQGIAGLVVATAIYYMSSYYFQQGLLNARNREAK